MILFFPPFFKAFLLNFVDNLFQPHMDHNIIMNRLNCFETFVLEKQSIAYNSLPYTINLLKYVM